MSMYDPNWNIETKLRALAVIALASARGHEKARFVEAGAPSMRHGKNDDSFRVSVHVGAIPHTNYFVAQVTLDGFSLWPSDPHANIHDALDNLHWLLCGTGSWTPRADAAGGVA